MNRRFAILGMLLLSTSVSAQNTDIEAVSAINFNFGNPGARSLAMGGAFIGLADDASAVEANPAGLTVLRKPEITLEGRNFRVASQVAVTGTYPTLSTHEFSAFSRRAEVAFGSFVVPIKNFAIAGYYHQSIRYTNSATVLPQTNSRGQVIRQVPNFYLPRNGEGPVTLAQCQDIRRLNPTDPGACLEYRVFPYVTAVDVDLQTMGLAGAWKRGKFSVGLAAKYQKFQEGAFTFRSDFLGNPNSVVVQATGEIKDGVLELSSQKDLTFSAGLKYAPLENLSIGAVYKMGAEFDTPTFAQVTGGAFGKLADTKFHVPDVGGLGVSWRPLPTLTLNADAVYVKYSNLTDDFISINESIRAIPNAYEAKDVVELHFGAEYFFPSRIPFALRAGWWRDPAHSITFNGPTNASQNIAAAILFPGTEDEDHFSVGVGLAWPTFQIDAAYDTSTPFKVGSISAVYRF